MQLGRLSLLDPKEPVRRYQRERPGELLHLDIKKLARFEGVGHRITGNRRGASEGLGYDFLHVAIAEPGSPMSRFCPTSGAGRPTASSSVRCWLKERGTGWRG